jgi:hypothetical protein
MSQKVSEELLPRLRQRYMGRGKKGRGALLDEGCEQFGYSRKHAIKLLGAKAGWGGKAGVSQGRPSVHGKEVEEVLYRIWEAAEQPCGKRLAQLRELWIAGYEAPPRRWDLPARGPTPKMTTGMGRRRTGRECGSCWAMSGLKIGRWWHTPWGMSRK